MCIGLVAQEGLGLRIEEFVERFVTHHLRSEIFDVHLREFLRHLFHGDTLGRVVRWGRRVRGGERGEVR